MAEHVRIELLDPRWKEKQLASDARRSAANIVAAGTDVASTLKGIASKRSDIFSTTQEDEERRKKQEEEERIRKREREKVVWDGHTASALSTAERFQSGADLDAQIAALHRAKGLTGQESNIGPRPNAADPAEVATAAPSFLQAPGAFAGATLSAAPNPQAQAQPVPAQPSLQEQQQQQMQYQQRPQYGYQPQYTPEQMAEIQRQQQQEYQAGQARPAEQSEESNKRQRQ
jgi:splicing factor 3A subunit 1